MTTDNDLCVPTAAMDLCHLRCPRCQNDKDLRVEGQWAASTVWKSREGVLDELSQGSAVIQVERLLCPKCSASVTFTPDSVPPEWVDTMYQNIQKGLLPVGRG